ncbi:PH domain-containing protein [Rohdeia mirabilis]
MSTPTLRTPETVLASAEFDERLPTYFLLQTLFALTIMFFTIPLVPIWFILGRPLHQKQYEALSAVLTNRALKVKSGVLVRVQKSIPLDKITDLVLTEGPILRRLGLCGLTIETAGAGSTTGQAALVGVKDAEAFRDRVLAQRDAIVFGEEGEGRAAMDDGPSGRSKAGAASGAAASVADAAVLTDIRDSLQRIERMMAERRG